jgi:hypothetical protein
MKMPDHKAVLVQPEALEEPTEVLEITGLRPSAFGTHPLDIEEPKEFVKYVRKIESYIRTAPEYREYVRYLADNMGMDRCTFLADANPGEFGKQIKLEMHHCVLTLFDVVSIVLNSRMVRATPGTRVSAISVADEVLLCHYRNIIPLVPLSNTAHHLVHSGKLFVGVDQVFGDMGAFVREYSDGFTQEQKDQLLHLVSLSDPDRDLGSVPSALRRKITVLDVEGISPIRRIETGGDQEEAVA